MDAPRTIFEPAGIRFHLGGRTSRGARPHGRTAIRGLVSGKQGRPAMRAERAPGITNFVTAISPLPYWGPFAGG